MGYLDTIAERADQVSPGISACQGCGAELILRRVLQIAGENTVVCIPPGCLAGSGVVGWNFQNGMKLPVHITLLDNTAAFLTGLSVTYQRNGREDVNIIALAGDGATADCGFQSLSGAAERGEKILYICYDNEGYMNTGFQRSSTTSKGSRTSTTPVGKVLPGKQQGAKNLPFIMAMHNVEYVATISPSHMKDFVEKVEKGIAASKRGFAYLHAFSFCPTGWLHPSDAGIEIARTAVKSNFFPLFESEKGKWRQTVENKKPVPVADYLKMLKKFKHLTPQDIAEFQKVIDWRIEVFEKMLS
ncbi:MAG: NADH-dependent phenylglyoxylate [Deltaproteobacteria bacterium]|jgi:pyruvate ferredoxin oxidoreductase beta subunit/phenylglyoxylate dehydrogenase beta subunit|nr:NADH-dependent phenylglyoxylate [Deltaproteobacteria bacterium]